MLSQRPLFNSRLEAAEDDGPAIDLTALMDVIFILLIFFILTAGFQQIATRLELPKSHHGTPAAQGTQQFLLIEITPAPLQWRIGEQTFSHFEQVRLYLLENHASQPEQLIRIAPARDLPVEPLVEMLNLLASQGNTNVQLMSQWKH